MGRRNRNLIRKDRKQLVDRIAGYTEKDNAAQLIFADWCEEHGEIAQAQLIRLEHEVEKFDMPYEEKWCPGCNTLPNEETGAYWHTLDCYRIKDYPKFGLYKKEFTELLNRSTGLFKQIYLPMVQQIARGLDSWRIQNRSMMLFAVKKINGVNYTLLFRGRVGLLDQVRVTLPMWEEWGSALRRKFPIRHVSLLGITPACITYQEQNFPVYVPVGFPVGVFPHSVHFEEERYCCFLPIKLILKLRERVEAGGLGICPDFDRLINLGAVIFRSYAEAEEAISEELLNEANAKADRAVR